MGERGDQIEGGERMGKCCAQRSKRSAPATSLTTCSTRMRHSKEASSSLRGIPDGWELPGAPPPQEEYWEEVSDSLQGEGWEKVPP
jgi:hypothetical protein